MDSEKRGSRLFIGRKLWPYFYKPEHEVPVAPEDTIWIFGEEIVADVRFACSLLIIEDTDLLELGDSLFQADNPTIVGSSAIFAEGLVEVSP